MTDREDGLQRLRWSLEHLSYLHRHPHASSAERQAAAWEEHSAACRRLTRIQDGARR